MSCPAPPLPLSITALTLVLVTHIPIHFAISHTSDGRSPWLLFLACQSTLSTLAATVLVHWPALVRCNNTPSLVPVLTLAAQAALALLAGAAHLYLFPVHMRSPPRADDAGADPDGYWTDVGPKPMSFARRAWWRMSLGLARDVGWYLVIAAAVVALTLGLFGGMVADVVGGGFGVLAVLLVIVQHLNVLEDAWVGGGAVVDGAREWGATWVWAVKAVVDSCVVWSVAAVVGGGVGILAWASLAVSALGAVGVLGIRGIRAAVGRRRGAAVGQGVELGGV